MKMRFRHDSQALAALNRWRRAHPGAIVEIEYSTRAVRVRLHALTSHQAGSLRQAAANALNNFERDAEDYKKRAGTIGAPVRLPPRKFAGKRPALVNRGDA